MDEQVFYIRLPLIYINVSPTQTIRIPALPFSFTGTAGGCSSQVPDSESAETLREAQAIGAGGAGAGVAGSAGDGVDAVTEGPGEDARDGGCGGGAL